MKQKIKIILISAGTALILAALCLCLYNLAESKKAEGVSAQTMKTLHDAIPGAPEESAPAANVNDDTAQHEDDLFEAPSEPETMPLIEVDGCFYCGYLTIPALDLELPVAYEWSYPALKQTPCRYSGSTVTNDIIIAAHNYSRHFGNIRSLADGERIAFTDCTGKTICYSVIQTELIAGQDAAQMQHGSSDEWDITLFTCDLGGRSRVTVRAIRNE